MGAYVVVSVSLNQKDVEVFTKMKMKGWGTIDIFRLGLENAKIMKARRIVTK